MTLGDVFILREWIQNHSRFHACPLPSSLWLFPGKDFRFMLCCLRCGKRSILDPPETFPGSPWFWGLSWIPVHFGVVAGSPAVRRPPAAFLGSPSRKAVYPGSPFQSSLSWLPGFPPKRCVFLSIPWVPIEACSKDEIASGFESGGHGGRRRIEG